jgi:hypothetical protein
MPPESFQVSQRNILLDAEASRAVRWGAKLGAAAIAYVPAGARAA